MSIFIIKMIACVTMVLDHVKYAIPETNNFITEYFGRIAFPLFAFLIGEGYSHTKNLPKYYKRLIIFACISQIPYMLFRTLVGEWRMLNVLFTLLLGLCTITIYDKFGDKYAYSIPLIGVIIALGKLLRVDYGWFGVSSVFVLYLCRQKNLVRILAWICLCLIYYYNRLFVFFSMEHLLSFFGTILPVILLTYYNGKLGYKTKYLYYIFYPAHMLILYFLTKI